MRRTSASLLVAVIALINLLTLSPARAAEAGVGVSTNGLQLFFDPTNYNGMSGTTLNDLSGNQRHAAITQISSQPSKSNTNGGYLSFSGSGGYATVGSYNFSTYTGITVSFYANFGNSADNFERIIDFGSGAQSNNIEVGRIGTSTDFFAEAWTGNTSPGWCRANGSIDSNWHFWVVSIGGGYCNIYKDNTQLVTNFAYNSLPISGSWSNMFIGKSNWADAAFEGGIAELAFYNRVIDSSERTQNYNAALDLTPPTLNTGSLTFAASVAENSTEIVTLTGNEFGTQFVLLSGNDRAKLSLIPYGTSGGTFSFNSAPNYEQPASALSSNTYIGNAYLYDASGNWNYITLTATVTNVAEFASLSEPSLNTVTPKKGSSVIISVTPAAGGTAGKVTFTLAGKRIAGCYKKVYSGSGNATCTWKPSIKGYREISVTFTPNGSEYAPATSKKSFWFTQRTTTR